MTKLKNIFILDRRFSIIAIGFLFLFSLIPYLNYNVYGQTTQLINGNGQGTITVFCPAPGGPSTINFNAFGTSTGTVTSGNLQANIGVTGTITGLISGGTVDSSGYTLSGQLTTNICPSLGTTFSFILQGQCSVNGAPVPIRLSSFSITGSPIILGNYFGVVNCNIPNTTDTDGDGVLDTEDNCPLVANPEQTDTDGDDIGNACDQDDDNDGFEDTVDNCPLVANQDQADFDNDGIGDACDDDRDGDGVLNGDDNCPAVANPEQTDTDGDDIGNACDQDDDNDGFEDTVDNCPLVANQDQADFDNDGIGDACDDETSLTVFKNQGQCIAFVNNNPEDADTLGITKDKCQQAFL